ncbi:MAG: NAD(P)H-dependent oxidoreductase [Campylobacteraceae bacterium]|nr:NAD(P)H-dependent oxidoreductase [Campylobacteraceae bacterium]
MKTLIISAHQYFDKSRANKAMREAVSGLEGVEFRLLDEIYGSDILAIDVKKEQELLTKAQNIVFQFPLFWYSMPPMLKAYQDAVFTYGFAHGSTGKALENKNFHIATTLGSGLEKYGKDASDGLENLKAILKPLYGMSKFCSMKMGDIFVGDGIFAKSDEDITQLAKNYKEFISNL